MRKELPAKLEAARIVTGSQRSDTSYGPYGAFDIQGPCGIKLHIIGSGGDYDGWEHVSVSTHRRTPNWEEMSWVKDLFWGEEECVVQFHPPRSNYVNNHPHCLHLWRKCGEPFPLPPAHLVGIVGLEVSS